MQALALLSPALRTRRALRALHAARGTGPASDRDGVLRGVLPEHRDAVARVVELASAASERWDVALTDFLEPPLCADALLAVGRMAEVEARPWGGYAGAERCRLRLGRPEQLDSEPNDCVALLSVEGQFMFDAASHRDFLGAVLGTGIDRNRVGDILVDGERGAQVLVTPSMAAYLTQSLNQVRSIKVTARQAPLTELRVAAPKADTLRTAEASLRLDAVASAGFRMSRAKMVEAIDGGDVKLNWRGDVKTSTVVKTGDVVSMRGKGRLTIGTIEVTKKERYSIELHRLL